MGQEGHDHRGAGAGRLRLSGDALSELRLVTVDIQLQDLQPLLQRCFVIGNGGTVAPDRAGPGGVAFGAGDDMNVKLADDIS